MNDWSTTLRRAADVERTHRQLRARLTDRLGGDDADRLADVDRRAARKIAPVALGADARARSRTSAPSGCGLPAPRALSISFGVALLDQLAGLDDDLVGRRDR